ncbi:MAG: GNAT family N-acetyltransferase [Anaerolineales bacterium]
MLTEAFREHSPTAWPTLEAAVQEVRDSFGPDRLSRVAVDRDGSVLGWIAGQEQYNGHSWELHPLVVHPAYQLQGIGTALVKDFETLVRARGATTIWLGTDDEDNLTSLGGADLYPNVLERVSAIRNLSGHPYEFYLKLGYVIVGVFPDANGPGKPDILMAKRVGSFPSAGDDGQQLR